MNEKQLNQLKREINIDFKKVRDSNGLCSDRDDRRVTGNNLMFTAYEVFIKDYFNMLDDSERRRLSRVINANYNFDIVYPIWKRNPQNTNGYQTHDDLYGIFLCLLILDTVEGNENGEETLVQGKLQFPPYVFNNQEPGKFHIKAWMGRFPQLIAHMNYATELDSNWFQDTVWLGTQGITSFGKYEAGKNIEKWSMSWMRNECAKRVGKFPKMTKWWDDRFYKRVPLGMGQVLHNWGIEQKIENRHWMRHPAPKYLMMITKMERWKNEGTG